MGSHRDEASPKVDRGEQIANIIIEKVDYGTLEPWEARSITRLLIAAGYGPEESAPQHSDSPYPHSEKRVQEVRVEGFRLEPSNKVVELPNGRIVDDIPLMEFGVLTALMTNSPNAQTRSQIMDSAGMHLDADDRVVDVYIAALRKKLDPQKPPQHIITVRGIGYAFRGQTRRPS